MARNEKGNPSQAEERFNRARKTNDEAMAIIDLERDATRKKTERLRKLRLAKEAEAGVTLIDKPAAGRKAKAAPRKRK